MAMATPIKLDMQSPLPPQLTNAPRQSTHINLEKDIPSDTNWDLLSSHFTSVTHLYMDSGWDERLNDKGIPTHWPLKKLVISSSCGERCLSPWILQGRVKHLAFHYTCGLRFEGPASDELLKAHEEAVAKGEKEEGKIGDLTITYLPDLVTNWMNEKYTREEGEAKANEDKQEEKEKEEEPIPDPNIQLRTLEIIYNDALDTFFHYALALPTLLEHIETLNLVASSEHDLSQAPENILHQVLPQLKNLKTLCLTIGDNFTEGDLLPDLVGFLPPNLEVLRFRSSVFLATADPASFNTKWVRAFADPTFLPNLKKLSFVLDSEKRRRRQYYVEVDEEDDSGSETEAKAEDALQALDLEESDVDKPKSLLSQAKKACERLYRAAESRGVAVEPWSVVESEFHHAEIPLDDDDKLMGIKPVDERWEKL